VSLENLLFVKDPIKMNTPLPKNARTVSDENRRFNTEWELDFFFIEKEGRCCCLLCNKIITVMKRSNLERHYRLLHSLKPG